MSRETNPRNGFENAVFAVGLALVLALVGLLGAEAMRQPAGGPVIEVHLGAPSGGLLPVTVRNTGGRVAEAVRVEACRGATCSEAEIPYVPAQGERTATLGVDGDGPLRARVLSFLSP